MIKRLYDIKDSDEKSIVWETKRQKDILDVLDELLENAEILDWNYVFEDDSFYVEYTDGTVYIAGQFTEEGVYRKKGISRIIYNNPNDTQVYGAYEVNEYGIVL